MRYEETAKFIRRFPRREREGLLNSMLKDFRCKFCHRLLAKVSDGSEVEVKCPKCKTLNLMKEETVIVYEVPENNITKKIVERGIVRYDFVKH